MNLIRYGEKYFDELELSIYRKREVRVDMELNRVSMSSISRKSVCVIRGIKDRRMGIYVVDSEDEEKIKEGIVKASKLAHLNTRDERWTSLPEKQEYGKQPEIDEDIKSKSPEFFVELLLRSAKNITTKDSSAVVAGGESGSVWSWMEVMNSHDVEVSQENAASYIYLYVIGRKGNSVTPGIFDMDVRRDTSLDTDRVTDSLLQKLSNAYNVVPARDEEATVIFEPFALGELLEFTLVPAIRGDRKVRGTSYLSERVGEKVLSEKITVKDDPMHPLSVERIIADDEGVASRTLEIFKNGVFRGFLWDSYWGNIEGTGSTGNGYRNLKTGGINITPHNMVIEPGKIALEDMIASVEHGYLVSLLQGAHSSNPDTGDFSVVANPAFKIENGEIAGSTVFMMSGNILSLLSNVEEISREQRKVYAMGRGVYPHIKFHNVKIASVNK